MLQALPRLPSVAGSDVGTSIAARRLLPRLRSQISQHQSRLHATEAEWLSARQDASADAAREEAGGGALSAAVLALRNRLEAAVQAEQQEQQRQQDSAYGRSSIKRLQAEGQVLLGMAAAPQGRCGGAGSCMRAYASVLQQK